MKTCTKCLLGCVSVTGLLIALGAVLLYALFPYPLHASCRVEWTVPGTCEDFSAALVRQMRAWEVRSYLSSLKMK